MQAVLLVQSLLNGNCYCNDGAYYRVVAHSEEAHHLHVRGYFSGLVQVPLKSRLKKCNMLKRKIETVLQDWKKNPSRKPLVIKGIRQCGKTFSVQRFAKENYAHNVYIDFYEMEEAKAAFRGSKKVDDIV